MRKTVVTIISFAIIAAIPDLVPPLKNYRIVSWDSLGAVFDFRGRETPAESADKVYPVSDASGGLTHFYEALDRTEQRAGMTRITHYGDSPVTADLITADLRTAFQTKFGDSGHGFVLVAKPWAWYKHRGVDIDGSGWEATPANVPRIPNGAFGLGAVSLRGKPGASSRIRLHDGNYGAAEIAYQFETAGGIVEVSTRGRVLGQINTRAASAGPGFTSFDLPGGGHEVTVRVKSGHPLIFGLQFLKRTPGIVYDSLGINGAHITVLSKWVGEKAWSDQLQHYQPDLVVINYGTNESVWREFVDGDFNSQMKEAIRRVRAAVPKASILVMSPMDRGERRAGGEIATVPGLMKLVTLEQTAASQSGCGFFNTFQAMGGPGTMAAWYRAEPRLVTADVIHPMPAGAKMVADLVYGGLMKGFAAYKAKREELKIAESGRVDGH
jgi:lysophospholipase L1-like esterase